MYLFTRSRRVDPGQVGEAMGWAVQVTESVKRVSGREVGAWSAFASPELGTITWTMYLESMVALETVSDQLTADADQLKLMKAGAGFFDGPATDGLATIIHGVPDANAPRSTYAGVAIAASANGRASDAVMGAIAIAEKATSVTGELTMVGVGATGPFGGIVWITPAPDLATLEAGNAALLAEPTWLQTIDQHGTAYLPGAAQSIYRRIA